MSETEQRQHDKQLAFYRDNVDGEIEIERPRGYPKPVRYLIHYKLRQLVQLARPPRGARAVVLCAGSGMDSEFLVRQGLKVIATDLSIDCLRRAQERARRHGVAYDLVVADAQRLPFRDRTADLAFVHDGLHHLPQPSAAILEMARVAHTIALAEPAQAPLTRLAVRLGISGDWEDVGNYVYRFTPPQLDRIVGDTGFVRAGARQHLIYYQPWSFRIYERLSGRLGFAFFWIAFHIANVLVGRWGNSLKYVATRNGAMARRPGTG